MRNWNFCYFSSLVHECYWIFKLVFIATGEQSRLQILQQYELQKSAFTICKGNFGGVKGKDFLCVMFLDGSLKFFEYDAISQDCVLPGNRTIPTNFIYVSRTDCFIILAPNWDLECYRFFENCKHFTVSFFDKLNFIQHIFRYLNLSESFERKFSPIWSLNVGEFILDMNSHQVSK
jgi:Bardet-Biedl syndrome 9 protein